jgi:hypothetical protein
MGFVALDIFIVSVVAWNALSAYYRTEFCFF